MPEENQTPLLPAAPWYTSPVQRAAVLATLTSAIGLMIQLFNLSWDVQMVNAKMAIVGQIFNLGFSLWAVIRRQTSRIAPLTLTRKGADKQADNSIIDPQTMQPK